MKKIITLIMIGSIIMTSCEKQPDVAVVSTRYGDMVLEFYPDVAEKHVDSFLTHARNGYFNGTTFHRVIPGFVIQGGDPNSKSDDRSKHGMGGHAANFYGVGNEEDSNSWMLPAEFNSRPHLTGTLSMARSQSPNSAEDRSLVVRTSSEESSQTTSAETAATKTAPKKTKPTLARIESSLIRNPPPIFAF